MKIYYLIAVWMDENKEWRATKVAEGEAKNLRCEVEFFPKGTTRVAVMEKKVFDDLEKQQSSEKNSNNNNGLGTSAA